MKIAGLVDALNLLTDLPFTEWAWSEAPADGYGVVTADGQSELKADADPAAEKMLTGYVDVFIKATAPDPTEDVEDAMRAIGVWFRMESIQFEPESGYLHFEWRWVDAIGTAGEDLYVIEFTGIEGIISRQIVKAGETPDAPTVTDTTSDGIVYRFADWDKQVIPATENTVYTATYRIIVIIRKRSGQYYASNFGTPFTNDQIANIVAWFEEGKAVGCVYDGSTTDADDVTMMYIQFSNITAGWQ